MAAAGGGRAPSARNVLGDNKKTRLFFLSLDRRRDLGRYSAAPSAPTIPLLR